MEDEQTKLWLSEHMKTFDLRLANGMDSSKIAMLTIHDIAPNFSDRISRVFDAIKPLGMEFSMAVVPRFGRDPRNDLANNIDWIHDISRGGACIALHGLYHEDGEQNIEDYDKLDPVRAEQDMRDGLEVFRKCGLKTEVFVPPSWKLKNSTIKTMLRLGLTTSETDEEILLCNSRLRLLGNVLNWDTGDPGWNRLAVKKNRGVFENELDSQASLVRMAVHPRDNDIALEDQVEMIGRLVDAGYRFVGYRDLQEICKVNA